MSPRLAELEMNSTGNVSDRHADVFEVGEDTVILKTSINQITKYEL